MQSGDEVASAFKTKMTEEGKKRRKSSTCSSMFSSEKGVQNVERRGHQRQKRAREDGGSRQWNGNSTIDTTENIEL
jgi:hypothetical protein